MNYAFCFVACSSTLSNHHPQIVQLLLCMPLTLSYSLEPVQLQVESEQQCCLCMRSKNMPNAKGRKWCVHVLFQDGPPLHWFPLSCPDWLRARSLSPFLPLSGWVRNSDLQYPCTRRICLSRGCTHWGATFALEAVSLPHCQLLCFQRANGIDAPLCDAQPPGQLLRAFSLLLAVDNARCYNNSNQLLLLLFLSCFHFDELLLLGQMWSRGPIHDNGQSQCPK